MSISDRIVVMEAGVVQQIGKPQEVYDNPVNLFVAKFLGTPPINVFDGRVEKGALMIGDAKVLNIDGVPDQEVYVGIRPEGFTPEDDGPLVCDLSAVEVMGRDTSIVSTHPAFSGKEIRAIIRSDDHVDPKSEEVRFSLRPHKVHLFSKENELRLPFTVRS